MFPTLFLFCLVGSLVSFDAVHGLGSYDESLKYFIDTLHLPANTTVPVSGILVAQAPYDFHLSTFLTPNANKDLAYVAAVVPLCVVFNLPNRVDEYFTLYPETLSDLLLGIETPLYTSDVFPTIATNLSAWRIALPMNDTGTAKAFLDSLTKAAPPFQRGDGGDGRYPVMRRNSPYRIVAFRTDKEIAEYVKRTPYSIGIMNYPQSIEYRLPCIRIRIRRYGQSDVMLAPRIHQPDEPLYDMDVFTFSVGPLRPDMTIYPFLGPLVFHISPTHTCTAAGEAAEEFLYLLLLGLNVPNGLKKLGGIRAGPYELNNLLAKAQKNLCAKGRVITAGGMDSTQEAFTAWTSMKYTDRSTMVSIDQTGISAENIDGVLSGKYRFSLVDIPPSAEQYKQSATLRVVPIMGTTFSLVFNLGESDVRVDMPRCLLTRILNGSVQYWDDSFLQQSNPSLLFPHERIRIIVRNVSEANWIITRGLQAMDKTCNGGREQFSVSMTWPFQTSHTMFVEDDDEARSMVMGTPYSLSFLLSSTATEWGMSTFMMWDPVSDVHVDAVDDLVSSVGSSQMSDGTSEILVDPANVHVYPFLGITYAVYDTDPRIAPSACPEQSSATSFFEFILLNDEANAVGRRYGFSSVPWQMRDKIIERLHREAKCNGAFIYPQPDNSEDTTLRDAIISVVCILVAGVGGAVGIRWYTRRAKVLHAPKDATSKFSTMLIVLKKESQLWETFPQGMPAVMQRVEEIIVVCMNRSRCYRVKDIGSAIMVTAKTPGACVALADDLMSSLTSAKLDMLLGEAIDFNANNKMDRSKSMMAQSLSSSSASTLSRSHVSKRSGVKRENLSVTFAIGIHEDVGRITYNQQTHSYDYSGPSTDIAAIVTDTAQGHQILISTPSLNSEINSLQVTPFSVIALGNRDIPVHQYNVPTLEVRHFEQPSDDNVDSIAATLQQKASGVATKRVLMMSLSVASVDTKRPSEEVTSGYKHQLEVLGEAVVQNKGYVHGFVGGRALVSFNAVYPTPQASKRAYLCVDSIREGLPNVKLSCGMQYDSAMVGPFQMSVAAEAAITQSGSDDAKKKGGKANTKNPHAKGGQAVPQDHHGVITKALEHAVTFHAFGARLLGGEESVAVIPSTLDDEFSTFAELEYLDFVNPPGTNAVVGLMAIRGLKQSGEMDEWMYELEEKEGGGADEKSAVNPTQLMNKIFRMLLEDVTSEAKFKQGKDIWIKVREVSPTILQLPSGKCLEALFSEYKSIQSYVAAKK